MAQRRLRDYKDPLGSYEHNLINLGVHSPGRFCGFDTLKVDGQLQFSLQHSGAGINTFDNVGDPYGPLGIAMSTQGLMVVEDTPITGLIMETNAGNLNDRIDYVVMSHQYLEIDNPGATATYSVIKGPLNQTIEPVLANFQVLIGKLYIPAGSASIGDCTYVKAKCPDSGDSPDAKLLEPNDFQAINQDRESPTVFGAPAGGAANDLTWWDVDTLGNSFVIAPGATMNMDALRVKGGSNKPGTVITLILNPFIRLRDSAPLTVPLRAQGYASLRFSSRYYTDGTDSLRGIPLGVMKAPSNGNSLWFVKLIRRSDAWYVTSVDGINFNVGGFSKYMTIRVTIPTVEIVNHFDAQGLGIADYIGWGIENGNTYQTPFGAVTVQDKRGLLEVGATNVPAAGAPVYDITRNPLAATGWNFNNLSIGGLSGIIQTINQLAKHHHKMNGNGNSGTGGQGGILVGSYTNHEAINEQNTAGDGTYFTMEDAGNSEAMNTLSPYIATFSIVRLY